MLLLRKPNVPLSATTYYFKDITDLITDTFTLFVEMGAQKFKAYWEESDSMLENSHERARSIRQGKSSDILLIGSVTLQLSMF